MLARALRMTAAPELKLDTCQGEDACLKCNQNHGGAAMPVPIVSGRRLHEPFNLALGEVLARWASAEVIEHVPTLLSGTWVCNFCYKRQVH
jgi:hypothetical protein